MSRVEQREREELEYDLRQWGLWSQQKGIRLNLSQSSSGNEPDITDELALTIDRAVAILGLRDAFTAKVLKMYYVQDMSQRRIESLLGVPRSKCRQALDIGFASVRMALDLKAANDS